MDNEIIFVAKSISKNFGPTIALENVDLTIRRGEIRGLVGENGSGKSTVMSIAAGMQRQSSGEMLFKSERWAPSSMVVAQRAGISMILQEANTIPGVTVAQNIFAGREKEFAQFGIVSMRRMFAAADTTLKNLGIAHIKGRDRIDRCSFEDRKLVELARCINDDTEILIVDETTTALSHEGRQILYKLIHELANKRNKSVVFISHDIDEILEHCDIVTVLRDGEIIGDITKDNMNAPDIVRKIRHMMVGREIGDKYYREDYDASHLNEVALELQNVSFGPIKNFSLMLHRGEIIGFGGLSGCGMHEIGRAAYGLEKLQAGSIIRNGKEIKTPLQAIVNGIGYISKNRDTEALILQGSISDNIVLPSLPSLEKFSYISPKRERQLAEHEITTFRIKCKNGKQWVNTMSGGNKQKVSFAKWTAKGSDVLIMDCPTRGVDIGVKQAMYTFIEEAKKSGKAIILISEELSELIGMADKLIIMKDFRVTHEFKRSPDLKQTDIIHYMV